MIIQSDNQVSCAKVSDQDGQIANLNHRIVKCDVAAASAQKARDEQTACLKDALALIDLMQRSASWRLTRPLRFMARLMRYGLTGEDRRRLRQILRERYHRLPLPAPLKRVAVRLYHRLENRAAAVRSAWDPAHKVCVPEKKPAGPQEGLPDYIIWGVIDWHFRLQRPQQLALALAKTGCRVFYISSNFTNDARPGFEAEPLDQAGRLFQIKLFVAGAPVIYHTAGNDKTIGQIRADLGEVLEWADSRQLVSVVQHPFWTEVASVLPNSRLVYDCMDHHEGFGNNASSLIELETVLIGRADVTVTTSDWLDTAIASRAGRRALIRNACDFEHFTNAPAAIYRDPQGRRVIGYYGAIAEWFDLALVETVAKEYPDCCVLLIDADTAGAGRRLAGLPNVLLTGEVPYDKLPGYLYGFDVCILPFRILPLTLATNPVKIYEYLSAGKPVVAVDLPEMRQFDGLIHTAADERQFLAALHHVLTSEEPADLIRRRKDFAAGQTWAHRCAELIAHAESAAVDPVVSVIVVTYNNLDLTRACLASVEEHSQYPNLEIIVVDNASKDGSSEFLQQWAAGSQNRRLILNDENRGFAAANNQGLERATGDYLVLLNNDTYVTSGWIRTLIGHLRRDPAIGLIGPVTNNIGNEAKIDLPGESRQEILIQASAYTRRRIGQTLAIRTAAFFCVMMPRQVYVQAGALDEAFGRGFFEDDDYCRRIERLGLKIVCAEDVFIHHHLSSSFNALRQEERQKLFDENKKIYEAKWGTWTPHVYRKRT